MGIPKFYKWLVRRYPMVVNKVEREEDIPPVDHLYLDMNGLIHQVIHQNSTNRHVITSQLIQSGNAEELWCELFKYIDDLVHMVNPKKLLFLALDSVTPVTKMTQQRARRMKDAHSIEEMDKMAQQYGLKELFDINAISPGTDFMHEVNCKIDFFLQKKVNDDPQYQNIKVVFSDSNVPGEGEHKIMEFLRHFKTSPEYDPNTRHCLYGLDADLIMLALVSHEPHMIIIREIVEHKPSNVQSAKGITRPTIMKDQEFEILYISILREYFEIEYGKLESKLQFKFDLERIIDDFIFFCLFVGNDFVPYLNTIDINYGSLDEIIRIYKRTLPTLKDYIMYKGEVLWTNAEKIFQELGKGELEKLKERIGDFSRAARDEAKAGVNEESDIKLVKARLILAKKTKKVEQLRTDGKLEEYVRSLKAKKPKGDVLEKGKKEKDNNNETEDIKEASEIEIPNVVKVTEEDIKSKDDSDLSDIDPKEIPDEDISEIDEEELAAGAEEVASPAVAEHNRQFLEKMCGMYEKDVVTAKRMYYHEKLKFDINEADGKAKLELVISKYLEGLQWVLYYYYCGVRHWGWYYPYHYAPLVSDITSPSKYFKEGETMTFSHLKEQNKPVTPFEQLLSILPKCSKKLLPTCYHQLYDSTSEIIDLYPTHYGIDYNGRALPWEAIKLIPFVDVCRVIEAEDKILKQGVTFSPTEIERNSLHKAYQYVYSKDVQVPKIESVLKGFPGLENSLCAKIEFQYKNEKVPCFPPELPVGVEIPCYDFPSLKYLEVIDFNMSYVRHSGTSFDSIELIVNSKFKGDYQELLSNPVFIGYPFQREAMIVSIITSKGSHRLSANGKRMEQRQTNESRTFMKNALMQMSEVGLTCKTNPMFACYCELLDHLTKDFNEGGVFKKVYSTRKMFIAGPLIMSSRSEKHFQNIDNLITSQLNQYPMNSDCVLLAEPNYGAIGKVVQNDSYGNLTLKLRRIMNKEAQAQYDKVLGNSINEETNRYYRNFISLKALARELNTTNYVMSKITSSIIIYVKKPGKPKSDFARYNIGLALKSQNQGVHVPYHVYYNEQKREWLISEETAGYVREYVKRYYAVVNLLEITASSETDETLYSHMLFPNNEKSEELTKEILMWVLDLPISKLAYIPSGSKIILPKQKENLKILKDTQEQLGLVTYCYARNVYVETYPFWIKPYGYKSYAQYQVGDRVLSIKTWGCGTVPFGSMGTIIGVYSNKIMVQFDEPLLTGSSYWGQCERYKGKILDSYAVINLSM